VADGKEKNTKENGSKELSGLDQSAEKAQAEISSNTKEDVEEEDGSKDDLNESASAKEGSGGENKEDVEEMDNGGGDESKKEKKFMEDYYVFSRWHRTLKIRIKRMDFTG